MKGDKGNIMKKHLILSLFLPLLSLIMFVGCKRHTVAAMGPATESNCVHCHLDMNPGIVKDHQSGKMGKSGIDSGS